MTLDIRLVAVDIDGTFMRSNYTYDVPRFERLLARDIALKTNNGAIKGEIVGSLADFAVDSHTSNGQNSLPASSVGPRRLTAHTSNAKISIDFVDLSPAE